MHAASRCADLRDELMCMDDKARPSKWSTDRIIIDSQDDSEAGAEPSNQAASTIHPVGSASH
jgi:hypothetical protein